MTQTTTQSSDSRVTMEGISWESYERLLDEVGDGHVRLTYDDGRLEIMSPSGRHELVKKVIGRIIEAYGDEVNIPVQGYGSTTFKSRRRRKGLEPDECYYVQHFEAVSGRIDLNLDLEVDPPPDLALEIDITNASLPRQPIYAAMGVAEIWRYDGNEVTSLHLSQGEAYVEAAASFAFPKLPMGVVSRLVRIGLSSSQPAAVQALREWIRSGKVP